MKLHNLCMSSSNTLYRRPRVQFSRHLSVRSCAALAEKAPVLLLLAGLAILSIPLRLNPTTPDVSWLIDVCARILNGERGYVDVFETTPPVPLLLYMPGAWVEKITGFSAEATVNIYAYLMYIFALWLSWRILPRKIDEAGSSFWHVIFPLSFYLFLLTNDAFAQRETFAAALTIPIICVLITWQQTGQWTAVKWRVFAIVMAGLATAIKPPLFALPLLISGGYLVITSRSVRPLYASGLIASAFVFAGLTAASLWIFPDYLNGVYQLMKDVYVPIRHSMIYGLLTSHFLICAICLVFAFIHIRQEKKINAMQVFFLSTAIGYILTYFYQAKFFDYHSIPGGLFSFALAWAGLLSVLCLQRNDLGGRGKVVESLMAIATIAVICGGFTYSFDDQEPRMRDRSWTVDLDRPTAMAIATGDITGFPLAREIEAKWINKVHCQWSITYPESVMQKQQISPKQRALFKKYQRNELDRIATLVPDKKPEIIIQSTTHTSLQLTEKLLERNPTLFDKYQIVAEEGVFRIWQRTE